jgi:AcrR family transcriptional regulator
MVRKSSAEAQATRRRLIEAALRIASEEGSVGLTTARLAREAGIVQSGFYKHFTSVDACVSEALEPVQRAIRLHTAEDRRTWLFSSPSPSPEAERHYRDSLEAVRHLPRLSEIAVRRRHEDSQVGSLMRGLFEDLVEDLRVDLEKLVAQTGGVAPSPQVDLAARVILGHVYNAMECVLEERASAAVLARLLNQTAATVTQTLLAEPAGPLTFHEAADNRD